VPSTGMTDAGKCKPEMLYWLENIMIDIKKQKQLSLKTAILNSMELSIIVYVKNGIPCEEYELIKFTDDENKNKIANLLDLVFDEGYLFEAAYPLFCIKIIDNLREIQRIKIFNGYLEFEKWTKEIYIKNNLQTVLEHPVLSKFNLIINLMAVFGANDLLLYIND
jgi:hypothetical protein